MRAHSEITWGTEGHWSRKHCPSHQLIVQRHVCTMSTGCITCRGTSQSLWHEALDDCNGVLYKNGRKSHLLHITHFALPADCGPPTLIMSKNYMSRNDELRQGDSLTSNNGEWKAVFQEDTNFVIYGTKPVWASDTYGLDGIRLCLQDDCNLVMYNQRHQILWSTNSQ
uniref:Bulb-type lectin domain-containing protein n=1 Tax=Gasterosteus aculeatus aculeatus TaxID=481459 RepID=A0AAQ4R5F4_GASAC